MTMADRLVFVLQLLNVGQTRVTLLGLKITQMCLKAEKVGLALTTRLLAGWKPLLRADKHCLPGIYMKIGSLIANERQCLDVLSGTLEVKKCTSTLLVKGDWAELD